MASKRIAKEFADVSQDPPEGFTVSLPPNESIHTWHVTLRPSAPSPYAGGVFGLVLTLPADYPFKAPVVKFVTRIYHPNITNDSLGNICLGLLKPDAWKPSTKLRAVLEAVRNLLFEPQPDDPLEDRIADEYRNDRAGWDKNVRFHVDKYAKAEPVFPPTAS
ncbi:ubiquitin-conjugating enzyme/RWD-like protein [Dactylonectria macrodidyma]|uniref:E2 ubiquitin-conjugating enzyme n=1 Tax=Dactylonectria macrodidyma TaxID=307937 RepID=A0A9P9IQI9_9HYPO|nr:ubiquitin-conjugating enzyme/RWD-like protein [Dactylonectria macrodidyma]